MILGVFSTIELVLKILGLWDQFSAWYEAKKIADRDNQAQNLDQAVDSEVNAKTEQQFDQAQSDIANNTPRP